ncbi:unnamed protein product, partial [Rotaria socialis]
MNNQVTFVPSINLMNAVVRQRNFLENFQKHPFYSIDLRLMHATSFEQSLENYISFMKLAKKDTIIVPTFDIDLIWHTHMIYPMNYLEFSTALCGYLLDHDDSIASTILTDAYRDTAERWKVAYGSEYGQNIDRNSSLKYFDPRRCAMIHKPDERKRSKYESSGGREGYRKNRDGYSNSDDGGSSCGG